VIQIFATISRPPIDTLSIWLGQAEARSSSRDAMR